MYFEHLPDGRTPLPAGTTIRLGDEAYKILGLIGYGGGSIIYDVENHRTKSRFALKEIFPASGCKRDGLKIIAISDRDSNLATLKESAKNEIQVGHRAEQTNYQLCASWTWYDQVSITAPNTCTEQAVDNTYALGNSLHRQGCSLFQYIQEHASFTLAQVLDIMKSVCDAYTQLHTDNILHGDVSLGNIFWLQHQHQRSSCSGQAVIIDFGQARKLTRDPDGLLKSDSIPAETTIPSTKGFTPPETLARENAICLTPAADVYGLTILFYILLGKQPSRFIFICPTPKEKARLDCNEVMIDAVNDVLERGTRFDPKGRYQDAGQLLAALQQLEAALDLRCAKDGSVSPIILRHGMMAYMDKHECLFPTEHDPQLASVLKDLGATRLTIYGHVENSVEERPIEDIFEECQRREGNWEGSIYIHAPGGGGKTFVLSSVLKENIRNPALVPLYLDMAAFTETAFSAVQEDRESVIPYLLAHQYMDSTYADECVLGIKRLLYDAQACPILLLLDNLHKVPSGLKSQAFSAINALRARLVVAGRDEDPTSEDGNKFLIHNRVSLCALPEEEMRRIFTLCEPLKLYIRLSHDLEKHRNLLGLPIFFMRYLELTVSARNASGYSLDGMTSAQILYDYFAGLLSSEPANSTKPNHLDYCDLLNDVIPRIAYQRLAKPDPVTGPTADNKAYMSQIVELGIMEKAGDQYLFKHDLYEVFFASFYIGKQLHKALEYADFSGLKEINHEWNYEMEDYWPALLALLLKGQPLDYKKLCEILENQKCYLALGSAAIAWWQKWNQDHFQAGCEITGINFDQNILRTLKRAAAKGHQRAAFHLAITAMPLNHKEELRWHKKSWKLGMPTAAANIAEVYRTAHFEFPNPGRLKLCYYDRQRLYWLKKGANKGNPLTMIRLGDYYQEKGNEQKARLWYRNAHIKGAELGIAKHLFELGKNYWTGDLVEKDLTKAIQCFYKAAQDYEYSALCWLNLGEIFSSSEYKDDAKAFICYKQAAMKGDPTAINKVGLAHFYVWDAYHEEKEAAQWFRKGMYEEIGHGSSSNLAYCYAHGIGVERNFSAALECYTAAALSGEWPALVALAKAYAFGQGRDRDIDKAIGYLEHAANQRIAIAQRALAYIHAFVNDDLEAAQFFYSCPLKPHDDKPDNTFIEKDSLEPSSDELVDELIEWLVGLGIMPDTEPSQILDKTRAFGMEDIDSLAAKLKRMQP